MPSSKTVPSSKAKSDTLKMKGETAKKAAKLPVSAETPDSYAEQQGNGGETHQTTADVASTLTTQQGIPVADDQNSLRAGVR
jgi:catalase